jgi:hypothetical protein
MANITVKKNDGTTDIVYDAISGSGGDSSPAVWRQDTGAVAGLPVGLRPVFVLQTKWNGPKTARQVIYKITRPYATQDSTTTLYSSKDSTVFSGTMTVPQGIPSSEINEAVAQAFNLVAASLTKSAAQAGYAPRG